MQVTLYAAGRYDTFKGYVTNWPTNKQFDTKAEAVAWLQAQGLVILQQEENYEIWGKAIY